MNLDENQNESRRELKRISTRIKMNLGENRRQYCLDCRAIQRKTAEKGTAMPGFYREDAKGSAAKSVRDRLTALLRSGLSTASVAFTNRTVVLAARNGHISISRQRASANC